MMEWLRALLEKAEIKDGVLDIDKLMSTVNIEAPKNVMSKQEYNNINEQLKTANATITDLKKNNKDNEDLQAKITAYETEKAETEKTHKETMQKLIKEGAVKEELYKEKVKFPELLLSKYDLSKIVLDEKGEKAVSGISEQTKIYKETYKELFGEQVKDSKGVKSFNPTGESNPDTTVSQGSNFAKEMNESSKVAESKFFN